MTILWIILCILVVPFGFVLLYGAPYLPTRKRQAEQALDLSGLKEGDIFVDLGSGDGAMLLAAARRGYICYGYEMNPLVWLVSKLRTARFGSSVHIYCKNFWKVPLPDDTKAVFVFLLDKYMSRLDEKLNAELSKGGVLVSYTFQIPGKKPDRRRGLLYLYRY